VDKIKNLYRKKLFQFNNGKVMEVTKFSSCNERSCQLLIFLFSSKLEEFSPNKFELLIFFMKFEI